MELGPIANWESNLYDNARVTAKGYWIAFLYLIVLKGTHLREHVRMTEFMIASVTQGGQVPNYLSK